MEIILSFGCFIIKQNKISILLLVKESYM